MVLLTMTPSIVEGLQLLAQGIPEAELLLLCQQEPSLEQPAVGNPISHTQVSDIWRALKAAGHEGYTLESLLKGSQVYVPPPPPKPEPSEEYKALMARLRREQEEREYQQMINPQPRLESFSQRFPNAPALQQSFAAVNKPTRADDVGDDDVTFNDVHRQLMLILNFIVSIFGVAASLWILARWWSTPARLFLTLGGSILVGIAEVALYLGYIWHLGQEKKKEAKEKEVKEVVQTWTVGPHDADKLVEVSSSTKEPTETSALRRRKSKVNE